MKNGRKTVIETATRAVMTDRNTEYAPPEQNFQRIADLWNTYLEGREITPYDTAIMMVLVKVARAMTSPHQIDHVVDIAGYAACAADVLPVVDEWAPYYRDVAEPAGSALRVLDPEQHPSGEGVTLVADEPERDEGVPLVYNGEPGRLFAPTDPDHDYCVWLSSVSGKSARLTSRQWEQAIDDGAAAFLPLPDAEIPE